VLAINDQEAELMEFAIASEAHLVLVLRGAGDTGYEPTIGATFDLLIDEFGLPLPQPLRPYIVGVNEQLTPQPTRTPAPTRVP
jgi:pilus assembly protein CpaB